MNIEVVRCTAEGQVELRQLCVEVGTTLIQAIELSGLAPGMTLEDLQGRVGIFGRLSEPDTVLGESDRVELYRPLRVDPRTRRRLRARQVGSRPD